MSNFITTYEMENLFSVTDTMLTDADIKFPEVVTLCV